VKQREEDSQCGKMMLRFREDKIKRLESTVAGLTPMDTYLLQEKNSLLEEVQILRNRLERNPEVTRFAMENIRLLEDLRRFVL
jgi:kinesin family protein 15